MTSTTNSELFELFVSAAERHIVEIVEICKPRSKFDRETHRVRLLGGGGGGVIRVCESQLRPWPRAVKRAGGGGQ